MTRVDPSRQADADHATTIEATAPSGARPLAPTDTNPVPENLGSATSDRRRTTKSSLLTLVERGGLLAILVATVIFFCILPATSADFATAANFRNITSNQVIVGVMALGVLFPLIVGEFDFSVGLTMELCVALSAGLVAHNGLSVPVACAIAIAAGIGVGAVNGILVGYIGLNSFITTFAVSTVLVGIVQLYAGGASVLIPPSWLTTFGSTNTSLAGVPATVYALIAVALLAWYLLDHTPLGRYLYAVGSNRSAARLSGLRVRPMVALSFVVSGGLAGVASVLYLAQQGSSSPNIGSAFVLPAYAALFLGATGFKLGVFNVWGTVVAIFFVAVGTTGLVFAGINPWIQYVFQGGALLLALGAMALIRRSRSTTTA
jgi:ribose transport system permease protein